MKILFISNLFPYAANKVYGIYTGRQVEMAARLGADITVLFTTVVAIVSLVLLLALFTGKLPGFAKGVYCNTLFYVLSADYMPEKLRPDQNYCAEFRVLDTAVIGKEGCNLENETFVHMMSCWEKVNYGNYSKAFICRELIPYKNCTNISTSELNITAIIKEQRICELLPNNDYLNCGDEDRIDYTLKEIGPGINILIEYDNQTRKLKVS